MQQTNCILLGTLAVSILGNMLAGKGVTWTITAVPDFNAGSFF